MNCIQDVPITSTAYLSFQVIDGNRSIPVAINIGKSPKETAKAVKAYRGVVFDDSFHVWKCVKQTTREEIAASIRRKQIRRTLLAVQSQCVFKDDLDVSDYWEIDWKATVEILNELEAMR